MAVTEETTKPPSSLRLRSNEVAVVRFALSDVPVLAHFAQPARPGMLVAEVQGVIT